MATIVKRGDGQYLARIRKQGFPSLCKTFPDRRLAEQWATVTEADMLRGEFIERKAVEVMTLHKVLARYASERTAGKKGEKQELVRIRRMQQIDLAKKPISSINTEDIENYIHGRRKEKSQRDPSKTVSDATIRLEVMLLSAVFEAAKSKRWNYCRTNPCRDIDDEFKPGKSTARTRRLVGNEETRLLSALDSRCRNKDIPLVVRFALATAARQSEIIGKPATSTRNASPGLCWEDINFEMRSMILRDTKSGLDRLVPLGAAALALLSSLPRPIHGGKVFNVEQDGLIRAMAAACKTAEIEDFTFHDLRHEATSRMSEQGIPATQIQKVTGHSGAEMLARYTHVDTLRLAKSMN